MVGMWGVEMFQGVVHQVMGVVGQGMGQGVMMEIVQGVVHMGVGVVQGVTGMGLL